MTEKRVIEIALKSESAESSAGRLDNKVKSVGKSADNAENSFFKLSKAAAAVGVALASAAVAKFFVDSNRAAKEFNKSMSNLSAITGAVGKDLDFLRETALEFGATTTLSATQAAEALKLVASAKPDLLSNAAALKEVTRQAVLLAEASGGTLQLADAAAVVGKALNQFSEDADQAARFVNVLAAGAKFGSSEVLATSIALKNAGVAAASAGVSFEETNAAIQVLAKNGIDGAEAGTALRNIFLKLDTDTNTKLRPSVVGLSKALQNLSALNETGAQQVKRFGLENIVAGKSLTANAGLLSDLTSKLTGTNTAFEQASTNVNNLDGDLLALGSAYESLQIKIGTLADGELRRLTQSTTEFIQALNGSEDALKEWGGTLDNIESIAVSVAVIFAGRFVASLSAAVGGIVAKIAANNKLLTSELLLLKSAQSRAQSEALAAIQQQEAAKRYLAMSAATGMQSKAITALAIANGKAISTQAALTATTNAYTTAARAASFASRGLSAAMALVGGPVGLAVIAASALYLFATRSDEAGDSADTTSLKIDKLTDSFAGLSDNIRGTKVNQTEDEMKSLSDELVALTIKTNNFNKLTAKPSEFFDFKQDKARIIEINKLMDDLALRQEALIGKVDLSGGTDRGNINDEIKPDIKNNGNGDGLDDEINTKSFDSLKARLKLETEAIQSEAEVRRAFAEGQINQRQLDEELALQSVYFNYESRRAAILENEKLTADQKSSLIAELAQQEIDAEQIKQDQITDKTQEGADDRTGIAKQESSAIKGMLINTAVAAFNLTQNANEKMTKEQKSQAKKSIYIQTAAAIARAYGENNFYVASGMAVFLAGMQLKQINAAETAGGAAQSGAAASPIASAAAPSVTNQQQDRVINIVGLENFGPNDLIPMTRSQFEAYLSGDENASVAINQGQANAQRIGAI